MESVASTAERGTPKSRIVLTSHGSFGDLQPYLAIALGLKSRGHAVVVATSECYRGKVETLGIGFRPVRPDSDWVADPGRMRRFSHPRRGLERVIRELWLPVLEETYEDLLSAVEGADLLVAMQANFASRLVAETSGMLWASAMHVPLGLASAYDPPVLPGFERLTTTLRYLGPAFWRPLRWSLKWATRRWARPWYELRERIGLPPDKTLNPLTDGCAPRLHLALFSRQIMDKQPDWPPQTTVTGFPWFDHVQGSGLPGVLARFLDDGPPPIVFTLGTAIAQSGAAEGFFERSAAAANLAGCRAVLILNDPRNRPRVLPEGVVAFDFVPFRELFPKAAAIVHHGGIGTTGLAMRAGRPMLVMPCAWDQPDNARRVARLGIARTINRRRYRAELVAAELRCLLDDPSYARRAAQVGADVRTEDGVEVACNAIERLLCQTRCSVESRP